MKDYTERIAQNDIGDEVHILNDGTKEVRVKKLSMEYYLFSGEEFCPNCHILCKQLDECWQCSICGYSITYEASENGEGYPTLEASYDDDFAD